MSADNGIYILSSLQQRGYDGDHGISWKHKSPIRVYRVAHAQAIDNFWWYQDNQPYNLGAYVRDVWGNSPVFTEPEEAYKYAWDLELDWEYTEYGINNIDTDYVFYGD